MSWQDAFTNYTTGMAFHISLSHDQASLIACLGNCGDYRQWVSRSGRNTFIPTFRGLEKRGLVEHNPAALIVGFNTTGVKLKWVYRLTPAGQRVFELLKLCGLAEPDMLKTEHHDEKV